MAALQKAWFYNAYGAVDVLQFGDLPVPAIATDEVLVKVLAAALNPVDYKRRQGLLKNVDPGFPIVPGFDVAGIVVKVGSDVKQFKEGDEVYGDLIEDVMQAPKRIGSFTEYTAVEEKLLALKPTNLTFAEAASLPLALLTAREGFERANFEAGQTVLVIGGAGGVGTLAIQLAKELYGASVVAATTSTGKVPFVKSLGADVVIDYTKHNYSELPERYDFVFDTVGGGEVEKAVKVVKDGGKVLTIAGRAPPHPAAFYTLTSSGALLAELASLIESKKLRPIIDPKGAFKFSEVKEAFKYLETGRVVGKLVITPIE